MTNHEKGLQELQEAQALYRLADQHMNKAIELLSKEIKIVKAIPIEFTAISLKRRIRSGAASG